MLQLSLLLLLATAAESLVDIVPSSTTIASHDDALTITCDVQLDNLEDMESVLTIKLTKQIDSNFKPLLAIHSRDPDVVEKFSDFTGQSNGHSERNEGRSYLEAVYANPTEQDAGVYRCEVVGVDRFKKLDQIVKVATITSTINEDNDVNDDEYDELQEKVQTLEMRIDEVKKHAHHCAESPSYWFEAMLNITHLVTTWNSRVFGVTDMYSSSSSAASFYIFLSKQYGYRDADVFCKDFGGYLAEINEENEFLFLQDSLRQIISTNSAPDFKGVITGAYLQRKHGDFVFKTHPQDKVYEGHFDKGEPHRDDMNYNWMILRYTSRKFYMIDGDRDYKNFGAVCEVSFKK